MRRVEFFPAVLFGLIVGWISRSLLNGANVPVGDLVTAAVTLVVGWFISDSVRRRGELDKVPIARIERTFARIEDLVWKALERRWTGRPGQADPELVTTLRSLSNELNFIKEYSRAVRLPDDEFQELWEHYLEFKNALTGGPQVRVQRAAVGGQNMRIAGLRLQWQLCRHMLDEAIDLDYRL